MRQNSWPESLRFVALVAAYQVATYFVAGMIASPLFDYPALFKQPILSEYYRPAESSAFLLGPFLQIARGILFGLILLPLRGFLAAERLGWLWLWLLYAGIGVLGTPAAAPSSLEGVIYTRLPLWFHALGLPEILTQTLVFSVLVHRLLRAKEHPLNPVVKVAIGALSVACFSFIGYTVVSIGFALTAGVAITQESLDLRVLGQFVLPLVLLFVAALLPVSKPVLVHLAVYVLSVAALTAYQGILLGEIGWLYVVAAPVLPTLISYFLTRGREAV